MLIVKPYQNSKGTKENPLPKGFDRPAQLPPILKAKLNFAVPSFKRYGSAKTESFLLEKKKEEKLCRAETAPERTYGSTSPKQGCCPPSGGTVIMLARASNSPLSSPSISCYVLPLQSILVQQHTGWHSRAFIQSRHFSVLPITCTLSLPISEMEVLPPDICSTFH